jgi:electron transfer flavoprotein alpha subunit
LIAWKPAFGGQLVAAIGYNSTPAMATIRPGVLPTLAPRTKPDSFVYERRTLTPSRRVHVLARTRDDDLDVLAEAHTVIGVGQGVPPEEYAALEPLRALLGAELGATRKVTDNGWLPRSRQIGITGRAIAPRLYVSVGASGKFNHTVGVRAAGTVLAINPDPTAPIFDAADIGIVGDWRAAVPLLVDALTT